MKYKVKSYNFLEVIGLVLGTFLLMVCVDLVFAIPIMYLWNWLMPKIFGLTTLTFWQSWGLSLLASLLFGRFNSNASTSRD